MKIQKSIRQQYQDARPQFEKLQEEALKLIKPNLLKEWHFLDRIKEKESFALKVETGRFIDTRKLEDFYACTIVVRNKSEIENAENMLRSLFKIAYRRPKDTVKTHLPPTQFMFDDLRLYVEWKDDPNLKPTGLNGLIFEVQVKTFLQHAWAVATHDLVYKSDEISWAKERIASQIRAMLDHAEISIFEAEQLSKSKSIQRTQDSYEELTEIIGLLREKWPADNLPNDLRRQSESIHNLLHNTNVSISEITKLLEEQSLAGRGYSLQNLSPYSAILQTLVDTSLGKLLTPPQSRQRNKILLTPEVEIKDIVPFKKSGKFIILEASD